MICPDCGHDNITGVDTCEACGQPLVEFDPAGTALEREISRHPISVLNSRKPVIVEANTTVRDAVSQLVANKFGSMLVIDGGKLVGIFTERDLLNKVSSDLSSLDQPVSNFMTANPLALHVEDTLAYAMHCMDVGGYRHLPIVDENNDPIGLVSVRDIMRYLCIRFGDIRAASA